MKSKNKDKICSLLFIAGIILFAVGIVGALIGYDFPGPIQGAFMESNGWSYFYIVFNWITIAGIAAAAVGALFSKGKKTK